MITDDSKTYRVTALVTFDVEAPTLGAAADIDTVLDRCEDDLREILEDNCIATVSIEATEVVEV